MHSAAERRVKSSTFIGISAQLKKTLYSLWNIEHRIQSHVHVLICKYLLEKFLTRIAKPKFAINIRGNVYLEMINVVLGTFVVSVVMVSSPLPDTTNE